MRRIFVAFVVCMVVVNANLFENDNYFTGQPINDIDVYLPGSVNDRGQLNREAWDFYSNDWLHPGRAAKNLADYTDVETLTFKDVFEKTLLVVTPSPIAPNTFLMFYLKNGLRTVHRYPAFSWLRDFFKHPGLKALIFYPHLTYNDRFYDTPLSSITVQNDVKMSDFFGKENCIDEKVPYLFLAPENLFDEMNFEKIVKVSNFKVYSGVIEVQPIAVQTPPVGVPIYRPQSSQKTEKILRSNIGFTNGQRFDANTGILTVLDGTADVGSSGRPEMVNSLKDGIRGRASVGLTEAIIDRTQSDSNSRTAAQGEIGAMVAHGSLRDGFPRSSRARLIASESAPTPKDLELALVHSEIYSSKTALQDGRDMRTESDKVNDGLGTGYLERSGYPEVSADEAAVIPESFSNSRSEYDINENKGGRSVIEDGAGVLKPVANLETAMTEGIGSPTQVGNGLVYTSFARSPSGMVVNHAEVQGGVSGEEGGSTLGSIVGNVASGLVKTVQTGAEFVGNVTSSAVKVGSAIVRTGTNIAGNVGVGVVKTGTEIVRTGTEIAEGVGQGIVHVGTDIVEKGSQLVENVGVGIVHAGTDVVRTGTGVIVDVGSGIIKTGTEIVGTVSSDLVEKGNKIVGDVAKIVQTNINATAVNVRNEFRHHHAVDNRGEPRDSASISSRNLESNPASSSKEEVQTPHPHPETMKAVSQV